MDVSVKRKFAKIPDGVENAARASVDSAFHVHRKLGPGMFEKVYERFMEVELRKRGFTVKRRVNIPIRYHGVEYDEYYTLDMLVDDCLILELKAVENLLPVHKYQLLTYLRLSGHRLGLLINFNEANIGDGITRVIN
jgi:GxxExxY protein